jgi:hypothetical protein
MNKHYKTKPINIIKLKSYLDKKPKKNERSSRQPTSRSSK